MAAKNVSPARHHVTRGVWGTIARSAVNNAGQGLRTGQRRPPLILDASGTTLRHDNDCRRPDRQSSQHART